MSTPSGPVTLTVTLTVDPARRPTVLAFYDAVFAALGLDRVVELVDEEEDGADVEAVGWGSPGEDALWWLVTGVDVSTGLHARLTAESRVQVETFFAAAVQSGGRAHLAPRRWTIYRRGEFGASVRDPLGNIVEAVSPE